MTYSLLPGAFFALLLASACSRHTQNPEGKAPSSPSRVDHAPASQEGQCIERAQAQRTIPNDAAERISVSHILVRHDELANPQGATRSRGAACLRALAALEALQGGAEWNDVVQEFSDAGKQIQGSLGTISRDEVTPSFADAAFSLEPNELSYVVETDRGFHVILRH